MGFCGEMVAKADAGEGDGRERGGKGRRVGRGTLS